MCSEEEKLNESSKECPEENKELAALVKLLDEPDDNIYEKIQSKILSYGIEALPYLDWAWNNIFDPIARERNETLIHKIQFDNIYKELSNWYLLGGANLLTGCMLVCRYQYFDLNEQKVKEQIKKIAQDVWIELNIGLTAFEKINMMNRIFFEEYKFSGNRENMYLPQNSLICDVLESRVGDPVALSVIYMLVANQVGLPVFGINLPEHFVLSYMDETALLQGKSIEEAEVLFYINPFNKGVLFTKNEIDLFLKQKKIHPEPRYYRPCSHIDILQRMLMNLAYAYKQTGNHNKAADIEALLKIFE